MNLPVSLEARSTLDVIAPLEADSETFDLYTKLSEKANVCISNETGDVSNIEFTPTDDILSFSKTKDPSDSVKLLKEIDPTAELSVDLDSL